MFGQLEDIERRFEEVLNELSEPGTTGDQKRFQKLMKEQADLTPLVETYREYKKSKQDAEDAISMLEEEKDPEMRGSKPMSVLIAFPFSKWTVSVSSCVWGS